MERFISSLLSEFNSKLSGNKYEKEKKDILLRFELKKKKLISSFDEKTFKQGFKIKYSKEGISYSPVYNGKVIDETEFASLNENDKKYFKDKSSSIQTETLKILNKLNDIDKKSQDSVKIWEENLVTFIVTQLFKNLKVKYKNNLKLQNFFYNIQSDIVTNLNILKQYVAFINKSNNSLDLSTKITNETRPKLPVDNYAINLVVNNDSLHSAPVILGKSPTYFELFGKQEFKNSKTGPISNYSMIKPGLIHKANGGYLILNIKDIATSMPIWKALKRTLLNGEIKLDASKDQPISITLPKLSPEPIPLNVQCILIGNEASYNNLCKLDPEFKRIFKIKAQFLNTINKTQDNMEKLARYVSYLCKEYNLLPFTKEAILDLINYSSKMTGDRKKLTAIMKNVKDLILETDYIARKNNKKKTTKAELLQAYKNRKKRYSQYDDHINEMINNGSVIISTKGTSIGQINGLTIVRNGDFTFGKPVRITANTFIGTKGIVNIEREVALSGSSHSKGIFILSAYIGEKYAQEFPLNLNASICFEQLYNGVDGDSASSTELYAILSSLASIPIKQNLAVTGSVNQKGEIQPIGGVSEKIEGFYNVCKQRGFEDNGVLIPKQNVENVNLSDEILESIKKGEFSIYPISTIDEGIELLTGFKAGKHVGVSSYPNGTINYKIYKKLEKYHKKSKS